MSRTRILFTIFLGYLFINTSSLPVLPFVIPQAFLGWLEERTGTSLPVPNPTRSFWIDTPGANPLAKEGSEGDLTTDADVCIIGSGITGVSAAYHLARQLGERNDTDGQLKAVILEARDFCSGATGRNGGHLTPYVFSGFADRQVTYGSKEARKIYALENYTATELVNIIKAEKLEDTVDLVSGGHIAVYVTEEEVKHAQIDYASAKAAGMNMSNVEWLDKETMMSEYGTNFPGYRYVGHNVWPLKLVTELYKLALRRNPSKLSLRLHTNTPVTAISPGHSKSRRWALSTPRGDVDCSYVIHATNGYAAHLLPHMRGPAGIVPMRGQVAAIRARAPLSEIKQASWSGSDEYWFPRPLSSKEKHPLIILGGARDEDEAYVTDDSVVRRDVGAALREFLPRMFPGKYEKGREPEMEWTGIMGFTALGDPFVGPVVDRSRPNLGDFRGQFIAAGYSGHGMPRTYACAEIVARMVTAEITAEPWTKPDWLPQHFLTTIRDGKYTV